MTTLITFAAVLFVVALALVVVNLVNEIIKVVSIQRLVAYLFAMFSGSFLLMGIVGIVSNLF